MGAIRDAANLTFADGPSSNPTQPPKPDVRATFGVVEDQIDAKADRADVEGFQSELEAEVLARGEGDSALDERLGVVEATVGSGLKPTHSVRLATTGNVTLSGEQTIDGETTSADEVLVWQQSNAEENGPYLTAAGAWTRLTEFDDGDGLFAARFFVREGDTLIGKTFGVQNAAPPDVGIDAIHIQQVAGIDSATRSDLSIVDEPDSQGIAFGVPDPRGRIVFSVGHDGLIRTAAGTFNPGSGGDGSGEFSSGEILALDAWAVGISAQIIAAGNPSLQKFVPGFAHVIEYGQSLSQGALGHPLRNTTALYDSLMIGDSVRPSGTGATFTQYGSLALNPLADTVTTDSAVLDPTEIEALEWMDTNAGQQAVVSFCSFAKFLWLQHNSIASDGTRKFVATSTGRGGRNLSELSTGSNFYARTVDGATKIKGLETESYLGAVLWKQGEADAGEGISKAAYRSGLRTLFDDFDSDIADAIYGQTQLAPKIMYQTSARWVFDAEEQAVQMAQLEMAVEDPDVFMAGPAYLYTNKTEGDGHLDANGYRWMGLFDAKCWYRVAVRGEGWQPLHIKRAMQRGNVILAAYHVPVPPLQFRDAMAGFTPTMYSARGFRVTDDAGTNTVTNVEIVGSQTIRVTCARGAVGQTRLWYASQATAGNGNVFDSDSLQAIFNYTYQPSDGDDSSANVAELVDEPYPLNNAAVVQIVNVEAA